MPSIKIWGRYQNNDPEVIDQTGRKDIDYLLGEYRLAFGRDWKLWAGRKKDEPQALSDNRQRMW